MSAPKFKFAAGGWSKAISQVECASETEKMVTIRIQSRSGRDEFIERKHLKSSAGECYFDTWGEAKELLMVRAESKLASARRALEWAQSELGNIKGMKPPKDVP